MKKLLIALVFVFGMTSAFADNGNENTPSQNSTSEVSATTAVTGKVVDFTSGEALVGAEIKIQGAETVVYTDLDGNFVFPNLKPGTYTIIVSYISYKNSLVENLIVKTTTDNTMEVQLMPESN